MVVRVLIATVPANKAGRFHDYMRAQLPMLKEREGLRYVKLARRVEGEKEKVMLYEEWRDTDALYAWAGPELSKPRLLPGAWELIEEITLDHYEALDIVPVPDD